MLFDTHAHMDDASFDSDRHELLAALPGQGISLLMNPGCSFESSLNAIRLSEQYDYIYAAVSILGTGQVGRKTEGDEDRQQSVVSQD